MDLNHKIEKYLLIWRNTEKTDRHFILFMEEKEAKWMFERATRTGPKYGVPPADGVPYAFPQLPLEKVLMLEASEHFVHFIQRDIAGFVKDEVKNFGNWGWYILKEIDVEKWKELYKAKLFEEKERLQKASLKESRPKQIELF